MAKSPAVFLLLRNADLHDPVSRGHRDLLVHGCRVVAVGPVGSFELAGVDVDEHDLDGARVFPALVDLHVHVTGGGGEAGPGSRVPPLTPSSIAGSGTGTVVGLLGTDDTTRSTADLLGWTAALRAHGMGAWCWTGGYHLPPTTLTGSVRGDIAWLEPVIGVGEVAISDHRSSHPTVAELIRIAADAHVGGLMTGKAGILHLHVGDGPGGLEPVRAALHDGDVPARVYHPTHVNRRRALLDEALDLVERGCHVDLTAFPVDDEEDAWTAAEGLVRYHDRGLPPDRLSVSSDGGGCLPRFDAEGRIAGADLAAPGALFATLRELLRGGVPIDRALPAFTSNPARLLRLQGRGTITPGAAADLLVVDGELSLRDVMVGGQWHLRDGEIRVRGPFEALS